MIKRLLRWLCRHEIAEMANLYLKAMAEHTAFTERAAVDMQRNAELTAQFVQQAELLKRMAYAEGECVGRQAVLDYFDALIAERTGGRGDFVSAEDLEKAKRGLLH